MTSNMTSMLADSAGRRGPVRVRLRATRSAGGADVFAQQTGTYIRAR